MVPAIGYGVREENRAILDDPAINAAEITYEQADDPLRIDRYLGDGREFDLVSVHSLELSLACPEPPLRKYLDGIKAVAEENGARSVGDHLGFTRDGDGRISMGHFQAPPFTQAALDVTSRNVERLMKFFRGYDFHVENVAYLFLFEGEMSEAEFIIKLLERTGCGWLLDVTNVHANAVNHGYDGYEFIRAIMPYAPKVQMHLAGGYFDEKAKRYFDSHSFPVHQEVWDLYRFALGLGRGKVEAVFIERDADFPSEAGWRDEVRQARAIAEQASGLVPAEVAAVKKQDAAVEQYRRQLNEWVAALAVADNEAVCADVAGYGANDVRLFTEGNLDKRADVLDLQTSFLRPAFDDLDGLIGEYVETQPQIAFTAGPADAAAFLRWLRTSRDLTAEQEDHVRCRLARFEVEDAARADRRAHLRFQERLSVARPLFEALGRGERVRVHLNPARGWARLQTREFLDEQTALPADVLFFAVKTQIHSAVLDEPLPSLLEALGEGGLTLAEWSARTGVAAAELLPVTGRLAELGAAAFS